jgi:hypothetical protein
LPRPITMPPQCGTSRVLPLAPPSCPANFSSLVSNTAAFAARRN